MGKCSYILWSFGIFYGHSGYFMTIWLVYLCSVHLVHFSQFWYEKSGNPAQDEHPPSLVALMGTVLKSH
jgi:hypothetical protein